tara:strand:- start:802 stop:1755 length:954 start_codon:yes stop_codon:yes gene_type:complete
MNIKKSKYYITFRRIYFKTQNNIYFYFQKIRNKRIIKENLKENVFAIEIYTHMGMGANLVWALEIFAFCNEKGLTPQIKFTHLNSKQKGDYFGEYFEIRNSFTSNQNRRFAKMRIFNDLNLGLKWNYNERLNLELVDELIKKYLIIKDNILNEVDAFERKHFFNKNVLGVHYRGTDKKREAKQITYETVLKSISLYLAKYPETNCVFVSSDESKFINYIENSDIDCKVVYYNDSFRSSDNLPIHTVNNNLYEINKDGLVNCLLLSRCNTLIKTPSLLSDWSVLFNPSIRLILLGKPYDRYTFFPGKEFYKSVLYESI